MASDEITIRNPYTGEEASSVPRGTADDIDRAVRDAEECAAALRAMPLYRRAEILTRIAGRLNR